MSQHYFDMGSSFDRPNKVAITYDEHGLVINDGENRVVFLNLTTNVFDDMVMTIVEKGLQYLQEKNK